MDTALASDSNSKMICPKLAISKTCVSVILLIPPFVIGMFSPIIGWGLCLVELIIFSDAISPPIRRALSLLSIFFISVTYASRATFSSPADDFSNIYYWQYIDINDRGLIAFLKDYIVSPLSSIEVGLPICFYFISIIFGPLKPNVLIFILTFLNGIIFFLWIERNGLKQMPKSKQAAMVAFSYALFSFGLTSQLIRQMFATTILLYAFTARRFSRFLIAAIFASGFHLIVAPIAIFVRAIMRRKMFALIISVAIMTIVIELIKHFLLNYAFFFAPDQLDKLKFYASGEAASAADFDIGYIFIIYLLICLVVFRLGSKTWSVWNYTVIFFCTMYTIMLPFPLLPFRFSLLVLGVLLGYLSFSATERVPLPIVSPLLCGIILWRTYEKMFPTIGTGYELWAHYPYASVMPLYYIIELLT